MVSAKSLMEAVTHGKPTSVVSALVETAGPAIAAEVYKGKGNGYGWIKNNAGVSPGGNDLCAACNPV